MSRPYRRAGLILLALLLAVGAAISRRETRYELRVEISSSLSSQAQLFYDIGQGFREENSSTQGTAASTGGRFQQLAFPLPAATIYALRLDPLNTAGHVVIRDIYIRNRRGTVFRFSPSDLQSLGQIAGIQTHANEAEVSTVPAASDPGLRLALTRPLPLKRLSRTDKLRTFAVVALALTCIALVGLAYRERLAIFFSGRVAPGVRRSDSLAARYSSAVLPLDSLAIWFYGFCLLLFFAAVLLKLNGSSIAFYSIAYGHGAPVKTWMGAPRAIRSGEW